jgi:hypothetical protein
VRARDSRLQARDPVIGIFETDVERTRRSSYAFA